MHNQAVTEPGENTALTPSQCLAESVRRLRSEQHIAQTELAERLAAVGCRIGRVGIQRIERGERKVDVDELVALGRAFNVPPVALLFPVGRADGIELRPGETVDPWRALRWFCGRGTLGGEPQSAEAATLGLYEQHETLMEQVGYAHAEVTLWHAPDDPGKPEAERKLRTGLRDLRVVRTQIRQRGLRVPPLDEGLEFVDDKRYQFLTRDEIALRRLAGMTPGLLVEEEGGRTRPVRFDDAEEA